MNLGMLVPVISAIGFGIQQFLQVIADPIVSILISVTRTRAGKVQPDGTKLLPWGISDVDAKKSLLGLTSITLGILIASSTDEIRILKAIGLATLPGWDWFITALTISAGTEGANSVLKLAQYVKDAVKAKTPPSVSQNSPVPQAPTDIAPSPELNSLDFAPTPNSGDDDAAITDGESGDMVPPVPDPATVFSFTAAHAAPWRVAKSLLVLRDQVNAKAPHRSIASDGFIGDPAHQGHQSDHNPWVKDGNMGVVTAFDITHDPGGGCDGNTIATALWSSRDSRIKYIIWNRRIANSSPIGSSPAWQWRPYKGKDPHTNHVHLSVKPDKPHYDSTTPWAI